MSGPGLTTNQRRALEALLREPTVRAASAASNLNERTIYRYLRDPAFRAELRARQGEILTAATAALVGMSDTMHAELCRIATAGESDSVRARAISIWAKHARDTLRLDELTERIGRLEELLGERR